MPFKDYINTFSRVIEGLKSEADVAKAENDERKVELIEAQILRFNDDLENLYRLERLNNENTGTDTIIPT